MCIWTELRAEFRNLVSLGCFRAGDSLEFPKLHGNGADAETVLIFFSFSFRVLKNEMHGKLGVGLTSLQIC